ncbi:SMI1/KNR4 family protein [Kriegella sp. EG-1]|nr:SMI1/KNR4 family protein [Flavobacteriaceae bacterium EG-1]
METEIIEVFKKIAEGELSASEWKYWFKNNKKSIEKNCGRAKFLGIKPKQSNSDIQNIFYAQKYVVEWLESKNISISVSNIYEKEYEIEFEEYCKREDEKRKEKRKKIQEEYSFLEKEYPKLLKQLTKSYDESTVIESTVDIEKIDRKEKELNISISKELKTFFLNISNFEFETLRIDFDEIEQIKIKNRNFLTLGEFWNYGDGDKLLYDLDNNSICVFAHDYSPPKIFKEAKNMKDFVEKKIVKVLKEYSE